MGIDLSPDVSAKAIPYGNNGGNKLKWDCDWTGRGGVRWFSQCGTVSRSGVTVTS